MKIAVCFKIIADYDRLSPKDWEWDEHHVVDTRFVRCIFNCFEESALEMALKLSRPLDKTSDTAEVTALTIDEGQADLFLKHLMAVGYDHVVRVCPDKKCDLRFSPLSISHLISAYMDQNEHQLVIFGMQGGEGGNGQTGFLVAEQLGWPCIREVTDVIKTESPDFLKVTSRIDGASLLQIIKLPMVLIIGHSKDSPYLRIPNLKQKLEAKKKQVTLLTEHDLKSDNKVGLDKTGLNKVWLETDKTLIDLHRPKTNPSCLFLEGQTVRDQARQLYHQYLKERLPS
jgi:electron transfer flavoprotein beta subunit